MNLFQLRVMCTNITHAAIAAEIAPSTQFYLINETVYIYTSRSTQEDEGGKRNLRSKKTSMFL
jgi:hypothetical protein